MMVSPQCPLSPLTMTKIGPYRWVLADDLWFFSTRYPGIFIVPRGFQTDLASIPRALWAVFPKVGRHDRAAVIHDAAYGHALMTRGGRRIHAIQHVADNLFEEILKIEGVPTVPRWMMVTAVRRFGRPAEHPLAAQTPQPAPKIPVDAPP